MVLHEKIEAGWVVGYYSSEEITDKGFIEALEKKYYLTCSPSAIKHFSDSCYVSIDDTEDLPS